MAAIRKGSILKSAVTLVTPIVFVVTIFGIRWIVTTQRSPGAITVVEAQGMDMSAMIAPPGVQPVAAKGPTLTQIGGQQSFPATVMAFSDEEIIARVPGKVVSLAYPGDHVNAGDVVARLDAGEYLAQQQESRFEADSSRSQSLASSAQTQVLEAAKSRVLADLEVAKLAAARAGADQLTAEQELQEVIQEGETKKAEIKARQADLLYAAQNLGRQETLYREGAVSLDQFQAAQRARDAAKADLDASQSEAMAKDKAAQAAAQRVSAMQKAVEQASEQAKSAQVAVSEASREIDKSRDEARASQNQALAARSQSESADTIAGYTQLRSLDSCMVSERFVSPGAIVVAGQRLLMLHNAEKVRIQAQLPEAMATFVFPGTPAVVHYGPIEKQARITSVFPTADTSTRTFTVEALIDNPQHRFLPGSFATMSVQTAPSQQQLAVRSAAIQMDSLGKPFVWVIRESAEGRKTDWTCPMHSEVSEPGPGKCPICKMELVPRSRGGKEVASRRSIRTGASDGPLTAVTSGLGVEDQVIWAGFEGLVEGSPVKSTPWGEDGPLELPSIDQKAAR